MSIHGCTFWFNWLFMRRNQFYLSHRGEIMIWSSSFGTQDLFRHPFLLKQEFICTFKRILILKFIQTANKNWFKFIRANPLWSIACLIDSSYTQKKYDKSTIHSSQSTEVGSGCWVLRDSVNLRTEEEDYDDDNIHHHHYFHSGKIIIQLY